MAPRRSKLHIPRFVGAKSTPWEIPFGASPLRFLAPPLPKSYRPAFGDPILGKARSFRCSSSPTATRFAGLGVGGGLRWEGEFHGPFRRQGPLREKLVPNSVVDSCHTSPVRDAVLSPPIPQKLSGPLGPPAFAPLRSSPAAHDGSALLVYLERQVMRPRVRS